jgi:hypothetical protein
LQESTADHRPQRPSREARTFATDHDALVLARPVGNPSQGLGERPAVSCIEEVGKEIDAGTVSTPDHGNAAAHHQAVLKPFHLERRAQHRPDGRNPAEALIVNVDMVFFTKTFPEARRLQTG